MLAVLSRQTFSETYGAANEARNIEVYLAEHFNDAAIENELNDSNNLFLVAEQDDLPVAYVKLSESKNSILTNIETEVEISRIYCLKHLIGKGVGKALMDRCLEIARLKKKRHLVLGVWEKNEKAISFYIKFGFVQTGSQIFKLGEDMQNDWRMQKVVPY